MILSMIFDLLMIWLPILVSVAFSTLWERKLLGSIQDRLGPNKMSVGGLLQPFADALKLFSKAYSAPLSSVVSIFWVAPVLALALNLSLVSLIPWVANISSFNYSSLVLLALMSMGVFPLLLMGWSSNSKYSLIGGLRGVAQTISYEISLAFILLVILISSNSLSLLGVASSGAYMPLILVLYYMFPMWLAICIAETNRTPFDFSEGESELVSGFNVEYGAGGFALIFMAEYGMMIFLSVLSVYLFLGNFSKGGVWILVTCVLMVWFWSRGTLPRYRYDLLMNLAWKSFLPVSVGVLTLSTILYS